MPDSGISISLLARSAVRLSIYPKANGIPGCGGRAAVILANSLLPMMPGGYSLSTKIMVSARLAKLIWPQSDLWQ